MLDLIENKLEEEEKLLIQMLKKAIVSVYQEDRLLLEYNNKERKGLEQAFVFRTGLYLYELLKNSKFSNLELDSEYNKCQDNLKRTIYFPKGIRPDLILHKRDIHEDNKMVVEFKGFWNKNRKKDKKKLIELTDPKQPFQYKIGVFVLLKKEEAKYKIFINGIEITGKQQYV